MGIRNSAYTRKDKGQKHSKKKNTIFTNFYKRTLQMLFVLSGLKAAEPGTNNVPFSSNPGTAKILSSFLDKVSQGHDDFQGNKKGRHKASFKLDSTGIMEAYSTQF